MEDYFKQITIEINSCLEQIFYLRIDLNINEIEIYYLNKEGRKQKELYFLGEEGVKKLKQVMSKDVLGRLSNQLFEREPYSEENNKWMLTGNDNLSVEGSYYLPKELKKIVECVTRLMGKNKFSLEIQEY